MRNRQNYAGAKRQSKIKDYRTEGSNCNHHNAARIEDYIRTASQEIIKKNLAAEGRGKTVRTVILL